MKYYIDGPPNLQINEKPSLTNKKNRWPVRSYFAIPLIHL